MKRRIIRLAMITAMCMLFTVAFAVSVHGITAVIPAETDTAYRSIGINCNLGIDKVNGYYYQNDGYLSVSSRYNHVGTTIVRMDNLSYDFITNGTTVIFATYTDDYEHINVYAKDVNVDSDATKLVKLHGDKLVGYYEGNIYYMQSTDFSRQLRGYSLKENRDYFIDSMGNYLTSSFGKMIAYTSEGDYCLCTYDIDDGTFYYCSAEPWNICMSSDKVFYSTSKYLISRNSHLTGARKMKKISSFGDNCNWGLGRTGAVLGKSSGMYSKLYRYVYSTKKTKYMKKIKAYD